MASLQYKERGNTFTTNRTGDIKRSLSLSEIYNKTPSVAESETKYGYSPRIASRRNSPTSIYNRKLPAATSQQKYGRSSKVSSPTNIRKRPLPPTPQPNNYGAARKPPKSSPPDTPDSDEDEDDDDDDDSEPNYRSRPPKGGEGSSSFNKVMVQQNKVTNNANVKNNPLFSNNYSQGPYQKSQEKQDKFTSLTRNNNANIQQNNKLKYSRHSTPPTPKESPKKYIPQRNMAQHKLEPVKKPMRSLSLSNLPKMADRSPSRSASRMSSRGSDNSSTPGSSNASKESRDIVLRKAFKNGQWVEQREEITYTKKPDGRLSKKSKYSESPLNSNDESTNVEESLSKLDKHGGEHYEQERSSQLFSRHGRGLIQDDQEEFAKEILSKMNSFRVEHSVKSLKINEKLSQKAREWAKYLAYSGHIRLANRHDVGESICVKILPHPYAKVSGSEVVEKWYSEGKEHTYDKGANLTAANFTQMIWRSTREVGAAIERSVDGKIAYIVVYFYPKGNYPNEHVKQVPPIGGFASKERNEKGLIQPHVFEKDESFIEAVMRAMNYYRFQHGANPLNLDKLLSEYAQEWADQLASEDRIRSRPRNIYGENIYVSTLQTTSNIPGQEPVEYWYKKKSFYNFSDPEDIRGDGRSAPFTQLVWQSTRDVGLGIAKSQSGKVYVVANFHPTGNRLGHFLKQVYPMKWK